MIKQINLQLVCLRPILEHDLLPIARPLRPFSELISVDRHLAELRIGVSGDRPAHPLLYPLLSLILQVSH